MLRCLRRLMAIPAKTGSQNAVAAKILLVMRPPGAAEAVETRTVLMVTVLVSAPLDAVKATDGVAKMQEK